MLRDEVVRFQKIGKMIWGLVVLAFLFGSWVATLELRQQATSRHIAKIEPIEKWIARRSGDEFNVHDHDAYAMAKAKADQDVLNELNERNRLQELRLQRLEDEQRRMTQTIEDRLKVTPSDVMDELKKITRER